MPNIDDYWFRYKSACEIEGQKLEYISKQALTELIAEIISSPVEPEVSQENCVWEILSKNGDSFYIILADCQKPHTMADSLFATTIYKYCPHCGRKLKSKLSSNFSG